MKPYKLDKINNWKYISELTFTICTALLLLIIMCEDEEYVDYYKTLGWNILGGFISISLLEIMCVVFNKKVKKLNVQDFDIRVNDAKAQE